MESIDKRTYATSPVRVAVLDDYSGDAERHFSKFPVALISRIDYRIFSEYIPEHDLVSALQPYQIICTVRERTRLTAEVVKRLPNLQLVTTQGANNAALDLDALKAQNVRISALQRFDDMPMPPSTVQHALALLLALTSNIVRDHEEVRSGGWLNKRPHGFSVGGKVYASLGLGMLGGLVARIAKTALNMRVIAWSQNLTQEKADTLAAQHGLPEGSYEVVSKHDLFAKADILAVQYALSPRSRGIVGADDLRLMKPSSYLVNTSRGPLVDEAALLEVLQQGRIRGAALDVYDLEPLPLDSPWRTTKWGEGGCSEVVCTPHSGYSYTEAIDAFWRHASAAVEAFVDRAEVLDEVHS